jgi:hypothetical protein
VSTASSCSTISRRSRRPNRIASATKRDCRGPATSWAPARTRASSLRRSTAGRTRSSTTRTWCTTGRRWATGPDRMWSTRKPGPSAISA